MNKPRLATPFVVTIVAASAAGCKDERPPPEPPPLPISTPAPPPTQLPQPFPRPTTSPEPTTPGRQGQLNPIHDGRPVRVAYGGNGCFVYGDHPPGKILVPGQAPPEVPVACPPEMSADGFQQCHGGVVSRKGDTCQCFVGGNPPPPARDVPCPP